MRIKFPTPKAIRMGWTPLTRLLTTFWLVALAFTQFSSNAQAATTTLPVLTNAWDQAHLFIIDKDTNSVFINANERFLESLRADFPEIQTVNDFIGKTDFDFYPTNLAEMYRADDQRVIAGGVYWETIERNEFVGGEPTYVFTAKTPLRDENGGIYALRIMFYDVPEPGQTTLPTFGTDWLQANTIVIDKDTNSVFLNANETFLATLRPSFPEIQSVTNLIGRDDYYFYDTTLAEKFRADDRRVLDSGIALLVVEDNQPLGGVRTTAQVTKRPLRRADGTIYGLRITAWNIPNIVTRQAQDSVELAFSQTYSNFVLERSETIPNRGAWEPVPFTAGNSDPVVVTVPRDGTNRFFRLAHREPVPENWQPDRPITLVVPFTAGGSTDQFARLMASLMETNLGQRIIVVNRPGASGSTGAKAVLTAPRDGYTWLAGGAGGVGLYELTGLLNTRLSDWSLFLPLMHPQVIVVDAESPYQTFAQLLADFRARPGELRVGTAGPTSSGGIAALQLMLKADIQFTNVFFNGGIDAANACAAGQIDVVTQTVSDYGDLLREGKLRALATVNGDPLIVEGLAQPIPPASEALPGFSIVGNYFGIFLPPGTPENVVRTIQVVWDEVVPESPELQAYALRYGLPYVPVTGATAQAAVATYVSHAAWALYDTGFAPISPNAFGIPRPATEP